MRDTVVQGFLAPVGRHFGRHPGHHGNHDAGQFEGDPNGEEQVFGDTQRYGNRYPKVWIFIADELPDSSCVKLCYDATEYQSNR